MTQIDYSKTINLPKTNFPMKANLPQNEPKWLSFWKEKNIYKKMLEKNNSGKTFFLHDGPPYANGHIHIGHALNKILKDIVIKYKSLQGYYSPYIPGWDCHGLPIEYQLFKELKISKEQISQVEFRKKAKEFALKFVKIQGEEFERLGIFGDWENPYLTINPDYEKVIIETLTNLVDQGFIYRSKKPVYWCINCETSLAEAEVEYADKISDSIYVKFKLRTPSKDLSKKVKDLNNTYILIWTTTPWTLPANLALAFKPDGKYVIVKSQKIDKTNGGRKTEYYIFLKDLLPKVQENLGIELVVESEILGSEIALEDKTQTTVALHPFLAKESVCLPDENVSTEDGVGVVHIAPGHGDEDYRLGLKYGLEIYSPVDSQGKFSEHINIFGLDIFGQKVYLANEQIVEQLKNNDVIIYNSKITHSYPHCWRCKKPVIFRATEQWFLNIDHKNLRKTILENINKVRWVPEYGRNRIYSMVELRPDWCLSRQRYWGVPIPAVYCTTCGEVILSKEVLLNVAKIFEKEGSDAWFVRNIKDFLPENFECHKCGNKNKDNFKKENDILDVWYDSAVSYEVVAKKFLGKMMYLEGSDQHRGWFQVALIVSSGINSVAPYDTVLTHGFVVDGEGKKMSKSLGNVISPQEVIKNSGAEVLRLWSASSDYSEDVRLSKEILNQLVDTYRKIRNTMRYILGNLYDFVPESDFVKDIDKYDLLDRCMMSKLHDLVKETIDAYEEFKFYKVISLINNFCIKDLSSFYFDILKDKLYTYKKDSISRRTSQSVLYELLTTIVPLLAPILSFTAEEIWQEARQCGLVKEESIFLVSIEKFKEKFKNYKNKELDVLLEKIVELRDKVNAKLEVLRKDGVIGSSLEAEVKIKIFDKDTISVFNQFGDKLNTILIVSNVETVFEEKPTNEKYEIEVKKFDGKKCPRCWVYYKELNSNGLCKKCNEAIEIL
jgi:isoleucyl-tRNA synthetase